MLIEKSHFPSLPPLASSNWALEIFEQKPKSVANHSAYTELSMLCKILTRVTGLRHRLLNTSPKETKKQNNWFLPDNTRNIVSCKVAFEKNKMISEAKMIDTFALQVLKSATRQRERARYEK